MKIDFKKLIIIILITIFIGGFFSLLISNQTLIYDSLDKPTYAPPSILFPVFWTIIYILMGISLYLVTETKTSVFNYKIYILQLIFNSLWTFLFFKLELIWLSAFWIFLLILLVIVMINSFYKTNKVAAYLNVLYLIWLVYACILNIGIAVLN